MPTADHDPAPRLSYAIGRLDHALSHAIDAAVSAFGLTTAQYTTLSILAAQPRLSNAQFARRAFVRPQSMNQVLSGLEQLGLARRRPDPDHGRRVLLELTSQGRSTLARCDVEVEALETAMLAGLSARERETLGRAVTRATENLRANALP